MQRIGLAAKLGLATSDALRGPSSRHERPSRNRWPSVWAEILQVEQIGIHDDFFASGGDSLLATHVLAHIYEITQIELEVSRFFEAPTVAEVAQHLETVDFRPAKRPDLLQPLSAWPEKMELRQLRSRRNICGSYSTRCPTYLFSISSTRSE